MPAHITAEDLLDLLPIVAYLPWRFVGHGIRGPEGICPLCALVNEIVGRETSYVLSPHAAFANYFDLDYSASYSAISKIATAADRAKSPFRKKLLQALGMKHV